MCTLRDYIVVYQVIFYCKPIAAREKTTKKQTNKKVILKSGRETMMRSCLKYIRSIGICQITFNLNILEKPVKRNSMAQ